MESFETLVLTKCQFGAIVFTIVTVTYGALAKCINVLSTFPALSCSSSQQPMEEGSLVPSKSQGGRGWERWACQGEVSLLPSDWLQGSGIWPLCSLPPEAINIEILLSFSFHKRKTQNLLVDLGPWLQSSISFPKLSSRRGEWMSEVFICLQSQVVILGTGWRISGLPSPWSQFAMNYSLCKHTHWNTHTAQPGLPTQSEVNRIFSLLPRDRQLQRWSLVAWPTLPSAGH